MSKPSVVSLEGTPSDLLCFQRRAWSNIVFSVTQRCPLRCRHCVTSSAPDLQFPLLGHDAAARWATELPSLAALGLRHITFTGGEPTLALNEIAVLARAAKAAMIEVSVVTSGSWGGNDRQVARVISALGDFVDCWDFGFDAFHAEHLRPESLVRAVNAAIIHAPSVLVRICDDGTPATADIVGRLRLELRGAVSLIVQPLYAIGRGAETLAFDEDGPDLDMPCMATGPFVREDGSAGPCCASLSYGAAGRHPFDYGSAAVDGLAAVWRRWRDDQLLRLIRLAGFRLPLRWLEEEGLLTAGALSTNHICETCEKLWDADGRAATLLRARASDPELKPLLDRLETELYGDVWGKVAPAAGFDRAPVMTE